MLKMSPLNLDRLAEGTATEVCDVLSVDPPKDNIDKFMEHPRREGDYMKSAERECAPACPEVPDGKKLDQPYGEPLEEVNREMKFVERLLLYCAMVGAAISTYLFLTYRETIGR